MLINTFFCVKWCCGFAVANKHIPVTYRTIGMSGNDINGGLKFPPVQKFTFSIKLNSEWQHLLNSEIGRKIQKNS